MPVAMDVVIETMIAFMNVNVVETDMDLDVALIPFNRECSTTFLEAVPQLMVSFGKRNKHIERYVCVSPIYKYSKQLARDRMSQID